MSIQIEQKNGFQIIRLLSDTATESDTWAIKSVVRLSLSAGIKNIILSLVKGMFADHSMLSGLLTLCGEMALQEQGRISIVARYSEEMWKGYRAMCGTLPITIYSSENDALADSSAAASSPAGP